MTFASGAPIRVRGADLLKKRLDALAAGGKRREMMAELGKEAVGEAKKIAHTTFTKTGNLERTIRIAEVTDRSVRIAAGGTANVGYAVYVEKGTGIYGPKGKPIKPKRAKMLAWQTGEGGPGGPNLRLSGNRRVIGGQARGGWAFAKSVRGRPATPYMAPGAQRAIERGGLKAAVIEIWNEAA